MVASGEWSTSIFHGFECYAKLLCLECFINAVPGYPDVRATDTLSRMYIVYPKNNECFYLRLLLVNVRGSTSFESLRTVNGVIFPTYHAACEELKLLENDSHWDTTIAEAIISASPSQIRTLFAIIILTCFPSNPCNLWHKYKDNMSEDILHQVRVSSRNYDIGMNEEIHNRALLLIEDMCYLICGNLLIGLGMPAPYREMNDAFNRELEREREYDHQELDSVVQTNVPLLNYQQTEIYDTLMKAIDDENGGLYFLDAPGGTSKTFFMPFVLATVRARSDLAVAVASLRLKVGSVVIMLRNINQPKLCNGTRLVVRKLMNNVIYVTIMLGKFKGEEVLIPRIPMMPTDMPFEFKRFQFSIRLAFAMTINKSQGQSLKVYGLNLEHSCFSHGQLYVACSRVGRPSALFVFTPDNKTKNIVYHNLLK